MLPRPIHWHEGMFLRPHHFQAAQRHLVHQTTLSDKWDNHYNWGLRSVDIDLDALANYRLVVRSMKARLRDGTLVSTPEDGVLTPLDLKTAFEREQMVTVSVGVPIVRMSRANVASNGSDGARYLLDNAELEDENTGLDPQPVQVRLLNLKLLLSTQDQTGYEVLPIARIEKSPRADAVPQLDPAYIPPVLACDAWKPLVEDILQSVYDRVGKNMQTRSQQLVTRGITFDSHGQGDGLIFEQMRVLNEAYATLTITAFAGGIHPLFAYMELARLVGQLAIFDETTRKTPEIPLYDHDDLGKCFYGLKLHINDLLDKGGESGYEERPFVGAGLRLQVSLEPKWLEPAWQMYVGVQTSLPPEELIMLLTKTGKLDMKLGSSGRVDEIFQMGQMGLRFAHSPRPPRALPSLAGLVYFQVDRQTQLQEWQAVQKSLTIALRLNQHLIVGDIQGQRVVRIRNQGQTTPLQFTLFVVSQESAG